MFGKKTAALCVVLALLIGYQVNRIPTPDNFENPLLYKTFTFIFGVSSTLAKLGARLNLGSEIQNFRTVLNLISTLNTVRDENVLVEDRRAYGVKIRVYSLKNAYISKTKPTEPKPVMIFYHGGAYCMGDLSYVDLYLNEFVKKLDIVVISVDYRLAPEHPHPASTDDCYSATKYVLEHSEEFNADLTRLILAGDSAGGNAAAVISQKLLAEKNKTQPKLQILIYPWVQILNFMLPSVIEYGRVGMLADMLSNAQVTSWYLGIDWTPELDSSINTNDHMALITDPTERERIRSIFDIDSIPAEYKKGKSYYDIYPTFLSLMYPEVLGGSHILKRDPSVAALFRKLYDPSVSPLLADHEKLVGLPKTYIVVIERDNLKDECLLYAERLKKAGVAVKVKFYENAVHGMAPLIGKKLGYQLSRDMQVDLINYIRNNI